MSRPPKDSKKPPKKPRDPAKPTRAKAARPETIAIGPALADLLNPAINRGEAGVGSQTGLRPPADNSRDRRADFSAAHLARKSTPSGFGEVPQSPYRDNAELREASPELARILGIEGDDGEVGSESALPSPLRGGVAGGGRADEAGASTKTTPPHPNPPPQEGREQAERTAGKYIIRGDRDETVRRPRQAHAPLSTPGVAATAQSLERLLREGRAEFLDDGGTPRVWTPHRPPRPEKSEGGVPFVVKSEYEPKGDQPQAIAGLVEGAKRHDRTQVLLGVTGSGKTFTMAKVIEATQRPAIILAPNKTLAAQLYGEFKSFFPDNAVEYFVSYYDYYQPEAYVPRTDTYIEKESSINDQIDRMRHSATRALLERDDVIIVASVSCIYGIGSVETYTAMTFMLKTGEKIDQRRLIADLTALQYKRTHADFSRGTFRVRGDTIDIFPAHYEDRAWRIQLFGDEIEKIEELDPLTGHKTDELAFVKVYANSHYVTPRPTLLQAIAGIKTELRQRLDELNHAGRLLEAQRLE
ncbi:MAG TPA: DEAD/DEAH box helicase family protein, partial [Xanthobacteraceae bacterium]